MSEPSTTMPHRLLPRLGWIAFAVATLGMLAGLLRQPVDPENRALKVPGTADSERLAQLASVVPGDPVLLLAFAARGEQDVPARDRDALAQLAERLQQEPGVAGVELPPVPDRGIVVMPVRLASEDPYATATRLAATAAQEAPPTLQVFATGLPLIEGEIARLVAGERTTIVPILLAVLLGAAWSFYGRLGFAVAVLLPALCAIAWTGGGVAWLGHRLDPVGALLDPVLLTIGVAASVHFVEAFRRGRAAGHTAPVAAARARLRLHRPAFWATVTTMLGLWSLTTNDTPAVVDFGLRAALGVALTHVFTFTLLPAWFAGSRVRVESGVGSRFGGQWLVLLRPHRTLLLALAAAVTALGLAGLPRVRTDNDPLRMLPADASARRDHDTLAARLGAVETFHLLVPAGSPGTEPERLLPFLAALRQDPGVPGLAGPVLRGAEGDLAVPMLLAPGGSAARSATFARTERMADVLGLDGIAPAGPSVQMARDSDRLMRGLLGSLGLSLLLLSVAIALGLRSPRLAVAAMVPNLLPSLWLYGSLGWSGRPVSVATAMIGCTMLGLIVDNTLHLLHRYRDARRTRARAAAMHVALDRCGRAMTTSSAVLVLGFLTVATSRLETTVEFALLAVATIVFAWIGTAVLLPALLLVLDERRRHDSPTTTAHAG